MQIWIQLIFKTVSIATPHDAMRGFSKLRNFSWLKVLLCSYSALKSIGTHQRLTHLVVVLGHVLWPSHASLFTYDVSSFRPVVPCVFPATLIMRHALITAACVLFLPPLRSIHSAFPSPPQFVIAPLCYFSQPSFLVLEICLQFWLSAHLEVQLFTWICFANLIAKACLFFSVLPRNLNKSVFSKQGVHFKYPIIYIYKYLSAHF